MDMELGKNQNRSHRLIKRAFHDTLQKKPFSKVVVNDLCKSAEVSRASFYQNFRDKYDLMESYLRDILKSIHEKSADCDDSYFISELINFVYSNKKYLKNIFDMEDPEIIRINYKLIEEEFLNSLSEIQKTDIEYVKTGVRFFSGGMTSSILFIVNDVENVPKEYLINFLLELKSAIDKH